MNLEKRQIWYFKEPRSGSTWLLKVLEKLINRQPFHLDKFLDSKMPKTFLDNKIFLKENVDLLSDCRNFYSTHYFYLLEEMKYYKDPYLIRITRRDKVEQCLSTIYFDMYQNGLTHYYSDQKLNPSYNFFLRTKENPIYITKRTVHNAMNLCKKNSDYWNLYSKDFETFTVVYEELSEGVNFPFYNYPVKFSDDQTMLKIPDYKKDVFTNYEEIVSWATQYSFEFGLS